MRLILKKPSGDSRVLDQWSFMVQPFLSGRNLLKKSTGSGKRTVEFFSAEMVVNVCKYRS